jgi:hypothetical protein
LLYNLFGLFTLKNVLSSVFKLPPALVDAKYTGERDVKEGLADV